MDAKSLIYNWNAAEIEPGAKRSVELDDETLRDGIQSPSITDPPIEVKVELLHMMAELGIQSADIGLPAASARVTAHAKKLAKVIADDRLPIRPNCAARTVCSDIDPIIDASQGAGIPIEASLFIGSSAMRKFVEEWTLDQMLSYTETAVTYAVEAGLPVMFVTEDTTRARPETLRRLYRTAIDCGARRICLADTVGFATPAGTRALVRFAREIITESGKEVAIDWHGHSDRGLALANTLVAIEAGANRVHATALGVGERCGNTAMELVLVNLRMLGYTNHDLSRLGEYCKLASDALGMPIPFNYPVVGNDAFRTCTGVHAAAVIKAMKKGDRWLADRVYSAVPAGWFGRTQRIEIGPMSGMANVVRWLGEHGYEPEDELVMRILRAAKESTDPLNDADVEHIIHSTTV